jgi:hypothetical protein
MAIYFSSKNIPQLENLSFAERQQTILQAAKKLTPPEKLILNIIKLLIVVPLFLYMAWLAGWAKALPPVLAFVAYVLVYRPVYLKLVSKHFAKNH